MQSSAVNLRVCGSPAAINALKGQAWADTEVKPDPTTQIKSVQVSAPVLDGGKAIGILHGSVTAD